MATVVTLRDLINAFVDAAQEAGESEKVARDIQVFVRLLEEDEELRSILTGVIFSREEKNNIVSELSSHFDFSSLTRNFLFFVVELNKVKSLYFNRVRVIDILRKSAGILKAEVISAAKIDDSDLEKIKKVVAEATGKKIDMDVKIDPDLLGGIVARVENKLFDGSLKTRLERIKSLISPS